MQDIYETIVEIIATYGAAVWVMGKHRRSNLRPMEMGYWRSCCRHTLKDRIRTDVIRVKMNIGTNIFDTIDAKGLMWCAHVLG